MLPFGEIHTISLLLNYGADVDADEDGVTALKEAAENENKDILELLLNYGADVTAGDKKD